MPALLDTCAWLWLNAAPGKLSRTARTLVQRERRRGGLIVSVFSV
jgi:PIN domain nuclease of toxin-antitoxin system